MKVVRRDESRRVLYHIADIPMPLDPVDQTPFPELQESYTFHSDLPDGFQRSSGATGDEGWVMGIDEAGRGPVLGPMVYAAAYCNFGFRDTLEEMGFNDSKALSADVRQSLWESFSTNPELCYSSRTLSPQDISRDMLRRVPVNLNRQAEDATISLIQDALTRGINIKECFVDALGPAPQWQARLSELFPTIEFTVCPKADAIYKIVGAASIIAKITRDRYAHDWVHPEGSSLPVIKAPEVQAPKKKGRGKGKRANEEEEEKLSKKRKVDGDPEDADAETQDEPDVLEELVEVEVRGSGYPSDPKTQAYLRNSFHPVFGYPGIVRFSWATVKVIIDKDGAPCTWNDDATTNMATNYFDPTVDKARPKIWQDVGMVNVGEL